MKHITIFNSVAQATACPGLYTPQVCMVEGLSEGLVFAKNSGVEGEQIKIEVDPESGKVVPVYQNPDFVDLGLSVKWCKYNLGATCQDTPTSWYGNYYAWGETEDKDVYNWATYEFGKDRPFSKYDDDGRTVLEPEDDAVAVNVGQRMPTKEECAELLDTTKVTNVWINNYNPNKTVHNLDDGGISGLNGRLFTSEINGNQIFIPAAGYTGSSLYDDGSWCYLWSSSCNTNDPREAWYLYFTAGNIRIDFSHRYYGGSVRSVQTK